MDNYAGANANGKLPGFRGGRGSWTNLAVIASSHIRVGLGFGVRGVNEAEEQCMEDLGFDVFRFRGAIAAFWSSENSLISLMIKVHKVHSLSEEGGVTRCQDLCF